MASLGVNLDHIAKVFWVSLRGWRVMLLSE